MHGRAAGNTAARLLIHRDDIHNSLLANDWPKGC